MSKGVNVNVDISCDVCCDLIPLVRDGVASEDSAALVQAHTAHCEGCRALLEGELAPLAGAREPNDAAVLRRLRRSLTVRTVLSVLLGVMAAMMFQYSVFRTWWLPLAGAVCYLLMRRHWPLGIVGVAATILGIGLWRESMIYGMELRWAWQNILLDTASSAFYLVVGVLVAALLRYALGGLQWRRPLAADGRRPEDETDETQTQEGEGHDDETQT